MNNIDKTLNFLIQTFDESKYFDEHLDQKRYRLEHTIRVANIGKEIAQNENLNQEVLIIACLLHDVGYAIIEDDWKEHGRLSAKIARTFLNTLDLAPEIIEDICYGIAIHVDGVSDFKGQETPFACSISDADNIDRFDVYRIYEGLQYQKFDSLSLEEKKELVEKRLNSLQSNLNMNMATETATKLWKEKISYQIDFFKLLMNQLINSSIIK